jgi:hypothetical protein
MMASENDPATLQRHITRTYLDLRIGIAIIGAILPLLLWLGDLIFIHEPLRSSVSAYYYSPVMRNTFVGALISIGVFLYLYKGFSSRENWALNIAGIVAVTIAMVPTLAENESSNVRGTLHTISGVLFFLTIAYVCMTTASDTLSLMRDTAIAVKFKTAYKMLGSGMIFFPAIAVLWRLALPSSANGRSLVFYFEAVSIVTFAVFWMVKSYELKLTNAETLATQGKLQASPPLKGRIAPGRLVQVEPDDLKDDPRLQSTLLTS